MMPTIPASGYTASVTTDKGTTFYYPIVALVPEGGEYVAAVLSPRGELRPVTRLTGRVVLIPTPSGCAA